jgi:hypothetical protein
MMKSHRALVLLTLGACLGASSALAETNNLDGRSNDPTYEVKEKTLNCEGGCRVYVINAKSMGVIVKGKDKKETKKNAQTKANELNEEAKEGEVSAEEDGVFDTCKMFPETC